VFSGIAWVLLISLIAGIVSLTSVRAHRVATNEAEIEKTVKALAATQFYVKYAGLYDGDKDNEGEYVNLDKLYEAGYHVLEDDIREEPVYRGYYIRIPRADEKGFVITAIPAHYKSSGRRAYWIDEDGRMLSVDNKGKDLKDKPLNVKGAEQGVPLLNTLGSVLADDLLQAAEDAFKQGDYRRCKQIIDSIRELFPQSAETRKVEALDKNAEPFVVDFKSREMLERAGSLLDRGEIDSALMTLRRLVKMYPVSAITEQVKKKISDVTLAQAREKVKKAETYLKDQKPYMAVALLDEVTNFYHEALNDAGLKNTIAKSRTTAMTILEKEAAELMKKAGALEADKKYDDAYSLYMTVKNQYGVTRVADGIDTVITINRKVALEDEAKEYIAELMALTPEEDNVRIISISELLQRKYAGTDAYKSNSRIIRRMERASRAAKFITDARAQMQQENYRAALASFSQALQEDPSVRISMKSELEACCLNLGDSAYESKDYALAMDYYQAYLKLDPEQSRVDKQRLMECYYRQAQTAFQERMYTEAEKYLLACNEQYGDTPEYNFMYGRILIDKKDWEEAVKRLSESISATETITSDAQLYWAYAQFQSGLEEEEKLRQLVMKDGELADVLNDYGVEIDTSTRRDMIPDLEIAKAVGQKSNTIADTFSEITYTMADLLDNLAVESDKLTQMNKSSASDKFAQRTNMRSLIQEITAKAKMLRAYQSAYSYRKKMITTQMTKIRKQFQGLTQVLGMVAETKKTPELIKVINLLNEKVSLLRSAEDAFKKYAMPEEQRQRTVNGIVDKFLPRLSVNTVNASVMKKNADELREMYSSVRDIDYAVQALRDFAAAYIKTPAVHNVILTDMATAEDATSGGLFEFGLGTTPVQTKPESSGEAATDAPAEQTDKKTTPDKRNIK
jgi:tetratricopeptide (TPR) repeat protein